MDPDVSVIIPHLNQSQHLARCLASLEEQDFPRDRFEVIVVDNGSRELPQDTVAKFTDVQLEVEHTPGPGPARNKGVGLARGNILAFIDADCTADPGWLRTISETLKNAEDRRITGGEVRIALKNPPRMDAMEAYESIFAYRQKDYIERQNFSGTGNLAVCQSDYLAIGPFGGIEIAEDRDWGHRATKLGYRITYVPTMIVYHPARRTFGELAQKWDRQIAHDFEDWRHQGKGRPAWLLRAGAVAASSFVDIRKVIASARLAGIGPRFLAALMLIRIRLYRAGRMIRLVSGGARLSDARRWNRR